MQKIRQPGDRLVFARDEGVDPSGRSMAVIYFERRDSEMRYLIFSLIAVSVCVPSICEAADPKATALQAVSELFVHHDLEAFRPFVADDAIQGDHEPGTAVAKL